MVIIELLILLALANGTPVVMRKVFGDRFAWPVDGGIRFFDGRPVFGPAKTVRGLLFSVPVTSLGAVLLGMGWKTGAVIAAVSMSGDLFSSFVKRRMKLPSSSRATGLDQIPEALFPLLVCRQALALSALDIITIVVLFVVGNMALSPIFYRLNIRKRPW